MLKKIREKLADLATHRDEDRAEGGFTLIELMVVVLIIAILIAIAIPTFLGARSRAQDRQAQTTIRATFDTAAAILSNPNLDGQPLDLLEQTEPRFNYTFAASTDPDTISFAQSFITLDTVPTAFTADAVHADNTRWAWAALIAARSRSGACAIGILHMTAGAASLLVPESEMPSCRAADVATTHFDDIYRKGGTSTGGSTAFVCADPACFGDDQEPAASKSTEVAPREERAASEKDSRARTGGNQSSECSNTLAQAAQNSEATPIPGSEAPELACVRAGEDTPRAKDPTRAPLERRRTRDDAASLGSGSG